MLTKLGSQYSNNNSIVYIFARFRVCLILERPWSSPIHWLGTSAKLFLKTANQEVATENHGGE